MQKKKTAIITARMTPEDKQKIEQRAANAGMTVTDYLTTCALGKKIVRVNGLDAILTDLKAQGRNLNQLTVLANMGKRQISQCLAQVYGMRENIIESNKVPCTLE